MRHIYCVLYFFEEPNNVNNNWYVDFLLFLLHSSYSGDLNTWIVWYSNGIFVPSCQMVRSLNGSLKTVFKKPVYGIWMFPQVTWLYHLNARHPYCLIFRWIQNSGVQYSDGYCIECAKHSYETTSNTFFCISATPVKRLTASCIL